MTSTNPQKISYFIQTMGWKSDADQYPIIYEAGTVELSVVFNICSENIDLISKITTTINHLNEIKSKDNSFTWEIILINPNKIISIENLILDIIQKQSNIIYVDLQTKVDPGYGHIIGALNSHGLNILVADINLCDNIKNYSQFKDKLNILRTHKKSSIVFGNRCAQKFYNETTSLDSLLNMIIKFELYFMNAELISDPFCPYILMSREAARLILTNVHIGSDASYVEMATIAIEGFMGIDECKVSYDAQYSEVNDPMKIRNVCFDLFKLAAFNYNQLWYIVRRGKSLAGNSLL